MAQIGYTVLYATERHCYEGYTAASIYPAFSVADGLQDKLDLKLLQVECLPVVLLQARLSE